MFLPLGINIYRSIFLWNSNHALRLIQMRKKEKEVKIKIKM